MIWATISAFALYVGVLNTFLARFAGTCTQGDADRLWGILISVPFLLLAVFCLSRTKHVGGTMIASLPALLLMLWQGVFAAELLLGVFVDNSSACEILEDMPYEYSGSEVPLAILWAVVIFGSFAATATVYFVRRSQASTSAKIQS
jgi:hypothetical protein